MAAGLSPGEFWKVTPREVQVILRGVADRIRAEVKRDQGRIYAQAVLNHHAFHARKVPGFDVFFGQKRAQSPEEMMAALRDHGARVAAAGLKGV